MKRCWDKFEINKFILDFLEVDWNNILQLNKLDVDLSFQIFFDKIINLVDKYAPLQKLTHKQVKTLTKPWITKTIQNAIHKRNKFHKLFNNTKDPTLKNQYELQYKELRNSIVTATRKGKKDHFSNFFQENSQNLKKVWKGINSIYFQKLFSKT